MTHEKKTVAPIELTAGTLSPIWLDSLLGLLTGFAGGLLGKAALGSWTPRDVLFAALFGLIFGLLFSKRVPTPGAGLIWALGFAFFLWLAIPA